MGHIYNANQHDNAAHPQPFYYMDETFILITTLMELAIPGFHYVIYFGFLFENSGMLHCKPGMATGCDITISHL